jgi:hypothetical protein
VVLGLFGPYHRYHGFCTQMPPVPGPPVIMHCSNEVKVQVVLPFLEPWYCTHHGRYVSAKLGRASVAVSTQAAHKAARITMMFLLPILSAP